MSMRAAVARRLAHGAYVPREPRREDARKAARDAARAWFDRVPKAQESGEDKTLLAFLREE